MSNSADKFTIGGRSYSKIELERVAEFITRTEWDKCRPVMKRGPDGAVIEISPAQDAIDRIFGGGMDTSKDFNAHSEEMLHQRLVLTRHFLDTGRQLIPEMVRLLSSGITEFLGGSAAWKLPPKKIGNDQESLLLMLAIDEVFPRSLPEIAPELGIGYDAAKARKRQAKQLLTREGTGANEFLAMLKQGLRGWTDPDSDKVCLRSYNRLEALELLGDPGKGEQFIKEIVNFFYK